jgi:carboxyl-terminal processing protease
VGLARSQTASAANSEIYRQLDLFGEVLERVRADYVEKPEDAKLIESAINGMLMALDPHSAYLNPKHFRDMQVQTRGEFGGLGIEVTMENGVVKVVAPIEDTPASKAGIQSGDLITHLDKEQILGLTLQEAVEKMRGPVNSGITLTIVRKGTEDPFDVKVVRDVIHINPVKYSVENDVGYIRVTTFNEQTTANLQKAIEDLKKEIGPRLKGFVIDLRNNPGGLLDQAISVSDTFLDQGAIVLTKGRNLEETQRSNARPGDLGVGNRCRRVAGPPSRDHPWHTVLRQGLGADHHSAWVERRAETHHRALLHALGALDSGQGHRARGGGRGRAARGFEGQGRGAEHAWRG